MRNLILCIGLFLFPALLAGLPVLGTPAEQFDCMRN
jgi:hypothetical protein